MAASDDQQPVEVGGLFFEVMSHSHRFADVTSDDGAKAFNEGLKVKSSNPVEEEEEEMTKTEIEIIDAVVRKESMLTGTKEHVEYIIKLTRGLQLKTLGKRYSELQAFHQLLLEHRLIDRIRAPPFPEKQTFRDGWYKFDHTDTGSDFVRTRKISLDQYLKRLFESNPTLYHEPCAIAFFGIEDFELRAAQEVSKAAADKAAKQDNKTHLISEATKLRPNMRGLYEV